MFDVHCFISPFGKIHCCVVSVASCVVSVVLCRLQRVSPLVQVHFSGIVSVSFDRVRRKGLEESLYQFLSNIKCNI